MKLIFIFILKFILNYMFFGLEKEMRDERGGMRERGRMRESVVTPEPGPDPIGGLEAKPGDVRSKPLIKFIYQYKRFHS